MKFCSPRPLLVEVTSRDLYQESQIIGQFTDALLGHSIPFLIPNTSYIIETPSGLAYRQKLEEEPMIKQLYRIEAEQLQSGEITVSKLSEHETYLYKIISLEHIQQLLKDDIIKIGEFQLKVTDICTIINHQPSIKINKAQLSDTPSGSLDPESQLDSHCRICWHKYNTIDDPLISLCRCLGSVQHTHYSCMKQWYKKFLHKQQSKTTDYYRFTTAKCDLCQQELPSSFPHGNSTLSLLEVEHPKQCHLMFELKSHLQTQIICLKFAEQHSVITIGSSQEADLCFVDDSIDQIQAEIKLSNNKILIKNKGIYSNTLMKLRENNQFSSNQGLTFCCKNLNFSLNSQKGMFDWLCPLSHYNLKIQQVKQKPF